MNLTQRQKEILKAIIEEYIETAEPVGSENLERKHDLGVSPATIRNEMIRLVEMGYLKQPHTSAGRAPTPLGFKYYIEHLLETKEMSIADEVAVKEKIWDYRGELSRLFAQTARAVACDTKLLSLLTTDNGETYYSGVANILELPEFYDIDITKNLLELLDEVECWQNIMADLTGRPYGIFLGEELGEELFEPCGSVFTSFKMPHNRTGAVGVLGANRINYPKIIPYMQYVGNLLTEITGVS